MGTTVEVYGEDDGAVEETRSLFAVIEATCSRFLGDSELTAINRRSGAVVTVSPLMARILEAASKLYELTGGIVDPAVGTRVAEWGYDRSFEFVRDLDEAPRSQPIGRWELAGRKLRLDPGTRLDLGGIAKGWACDEAVDRGMAVIVNAGGDVRSVHPETRAEILDADERVAATLVVGKGGLATSSVLRRRWQAGGRPVHHVIDPRTGDPAESPVASATAVSDRAFLAEAGAKTMLIRGAEALAWADRQPWLSSGVVVWHDGSVYATAGCEVAA